MPGDHDAVDHKGQFPPFTSLKFNWNQDNLSNSKASKGVAEFTFTGQFEKCLNGILNWLGIDAYPVYDNLPISEDDKKERSKPLDAFKHCFKAERNIFQSWCTLGSFSVVLSKPNPNSIINSTVWQTVLISPKQMRL